MDKVGSALPTGCSTFRGYNPTETFILFRTKPLINGFVFLRFIMHEIYEAQKFSRSSQYLRFILKVGLSLITLDFLRRGNAEGGLDL